jgi:hypothetical protein
MVFFPFVVEFSICVQKGKKTQERKIALHHQLSCGNPTKKLDILAQV